ncbi:MAG TPA: hypothetical protein VFF63_06830 [Candidatus Babeliales bacterium]|nr:hypothetical protein [Candidatus Babeliales bacterium]
MVRVAAVLLLLLPALLGTALADCKIHRGDRVVLYSTTDDPSVLLWDSRARLREYYAASFDEAHAMLPHATLVAPGTHATVTSCTSNYVDSPIFERPADAIAVVTTSGPQRGLLRWVLGSDVRRLPNP